MAKVCKREWESPKGSGNWKHAWYVAYKVDGQWKRKTPKPNKKHVADALKEEIERNIADGKHIVRHGTKTVEEAAQAWFDNCVTIRKLAGGTLENYRRHLRLRILPELGKIKLVDLRSERIECWINDLAPKTKYAHVGAYWNLYDILNYAAKKKWCSNPLVVDPIDPPTREPANIIVGTRQEIRALLEAAVTPIRRQGVRKYTHEIRAATLLLAAVHGLRKGEIAGLQWENVDLVEGEIRVRHSWSKRGGLGPPKTKAGKREVPMSPLLRPWLERIRESGQPDDRLRVRCRREAVLQ
jgi:integrase